MRMLRKQCLLQDFNFSGHQHCERNGDAPAGEEVFSWLSTMLVGDGVLSYEVR